MTPATDLVIDRIGNDLMSFELNPPEKQQVDDQSDTHRKHLRALFDECPEVGAINLPEIQEEEQKGDRGDRKSDFKVRTSPREYARHLRETFPREFVINRVIVQSPPAQQERWLLETHEQYDIKSLVIVGGESSNTTYPGPSVTEGNRLVKEYLNRGRSRYTDEPVEPTDFMVGNICISTRRREEFDEPDRMIKKIRSGCDFFTSQIIAESESPTNLLVDLATRLEQQNVKPPVLLWSITPINSRKDVRFLRWLGVRVPDSVEETILGSPNPLATSLDYFQDVWHELLETEEQLDMDIPMGVNISPVAIRNLGPSIQLTKRLQKSTSVTSP